MTRNTKQSVIDVKNKKPRYGATILLYKTNGSAKVTDGKIDMGWCSGVNLGIYTNLFKDRGRIFFAKRKSKIVKHKWKPGNRCYWKYIKGL